jgi:hypothetical protein
VGTKRAVFIFGRGNKSPRIEKQAAQSSRHSSSLPPMLLAASSQGIRNAVTTKGRPAGWKRALQSFAFFPPRDPLIVTGSSLLRYSSRFCYLQGDAVFACAGVITLMG